MKTHNPIPWQWPVQPWNDNSGLKPKDLCTCGHCGLSWDDGQSTSMTPAPSGRCPFEAFHVYESDDEEEELDLNLIIERQAKVIEHLSKREQLALNLMRRAMFFLEAYRCPDAGNESEWLKATIKAIEDFCKPV